MNALDNLARKIGGKPVNILLLLIGCSIAYLGLNAFYHSETQQRIAQNQQIHQQQAMLMLDVLKTKIAGLQTTLKAVATSTEYASLNQPYGSQELAFEQDHLLRLFPGADKVCLVSADITEPKETACIPISFATVNSIRLAKEDGMAPLAIMKVGTPEAHLLLAHQLVDHSQQVAGVLLVSYPKTFLQNLLPSNLASDAYMELQQGTKRITKVSSQGDVVRRQGSPLIQQPLKGSYWKLAYWSDAQQINMLPWTVLLMIFGSVIVCWILKDAWLYYLLKIDIKTLSQQIRDLKSNKMKPDYLLSNKALDDVKDDIRTIAYEKKVERPKTKANSSAEKVEVDVVNEVVEEPPSLDVEPRLFGPYDIRETDGLTIDANTARTIGLAIGSEALDQGQQALVVARDARLSNEQLAQAMMDGITASGCNVIDIGVVAIPLFYFACEKLGSPSGVMITTSQLHAQSASIKFVLNNRALTEDALRGLYTRIEQQKLRSGNGVKTAKVVIDEYIKAVVENVSIARSLKVVIDCGNAVTGLVAPKLFKALGCDVVELYCDVESKQSNHAPNPSDPDNLQDLINAVQQNEAELGIAFDGDGDRLSVVDTQGEIITPDRLMVMLAQSVLVEDPEATILYDVKSTNLLADVVSRAGGNPVMSPSGYAIIKNKAHGVGAKLAGEFAGHIYFNDKWFGFDDALYAAARLFEFLANDPLERAPTEVFSALPQRAATPEILVELDGDEAVTFVNELQNQAEFSGAELIKVDGLRVEFPDCWGLIRVSNTQNCLSLRFEANNESALENIKQQFKQQMLQIKPTLRLSF